MGNMKTDGGGGWHASTPAVYREGPSPEPGYRRGYPRQWERYVGHGEPQPTHPERHRISYAVPLSICEIFVKQRPSMGG